MRFPLVVTAGVLLKGLGLAVPAALPAQVAAVPLPGWPTGQLLEGDGAGSSLEPAHVSLIPLSRSSATRAHTGTGLLIGVGSGWRPRRCSSSGSVAILIRHAGPTRSAGPC